MIHEMDMQMGLRCRGDVKCYIMMHLSVPERGASVKVL